MTFISNPHPLEYKRQDQLFGSGDPSAMLKAAPPGKSPHDKDDKRLIELLSEKREQEQTIKNSEKRLDEYKRTHSKYRSIAQQDETVKNMAMRLNTDRSKLSDLNEEYYHITQRLKGLER